MGNVEEMCFTFWNLTAIYSCAGLLGKLGFSKSHSDLLKDTQHDGEDNSQSEFQE